MGRIDEAMSRANLDAGRGTGAEAPVPVPSPWPVEQPADGSAPGPEGPVPGAPAAAADRGRMAPAESGRPARWGGFDPDALERLVASKTAPSALVEQFRSLAAALHRAQAEQHLKSVLVTSATPGDGKSHVSVNLALTLSDSYERRVLLIDADLRQPVLHRVFCVPNARGLADALNGKSGEPPSLVKISETLTLLPAGGAGASPLSGLSSDRMKHLIAEAASHFDWVILDSPPAGVLADARLMSETVDAALLVVRAGVTRFEDLEAAADRLGHDRIIGLVLNAIDPAEISGQHYYDHHYGGSSQKS